MVRQLPLLAISFTLFLFLMLSITKQWIVPPESFGMLHILLFVMNAFGLTLALLFGRTTLFLLLLLFLTLGVITETFDYLRHAHFQVWKSTPVGTMIDIVIQLFLPPFIVLLAWFENRAIFSFAGVLRLILIAIFPLLVVIWLYAPYSLGINEILMFDFVILPEIGIAHITLLVWALSFGSLYILIFVHKEHFKTIFLVALFGTILTASLPKTLDYYLLFSALFSLLSIFFIISNSYYMAYIDELTGIKGRRAMNEALIRLGNKYSIVMVDIDHFKKFNDTYGHDIGDEVLKLVAKLINKVTGGAEAFRWGGEEFAMIFNGKTAQEVFSHADAVRQAIELHPFYIRDPDRPEDKPEMPKGHPVKEVQITVSMGIGQRTKEDFDVEAVMKKADDLLYVAKEAGRNCVKF
ncbi:MAG: GGDEF domain-containing protein [Thiovulaceae bacterium]|nr:GGDEF domain-containing protein [Sulfurimonadaceae bacterium]